MAEPDLKKRKVEEDVKKEVKEEAKEPPKEEETNAKADTRPPLVKTVGFETRDTTVNVITMLGGKVLVPLTDGGFQYLIAGARANVGVKAGRYLYEIKIVELLNPLEAPNNRGVRPPGPRQLVRIGFSTQEAPLFLGETDDSFGFDSEGFFTLEKERKASSVRFGKDNVIGILLNLDASSKNKNTVSLFKDGERVTQPIALPGRFKGKPLFPTVNFKNVTLQVNFGPSPLSPLPFTTRTVAQVPKEEGVQAPETAKGGKYEVLFPVGIPDEGTFDWLDEFLEKNPHWTELSDRAISKWAQRSGLVKPKQVSWKHSNDKPDMNFGIPMLDDMSVRRVLASVVATQPRNYIVMEVKGNLTAEERKVLVQRFSAPHYRRIAEVVIGEPPATYKKWVQSQILKDRQEQLTQEWSARKAEKEKKKAEEARKAELEEAKKKAQEEMRKRLEEKSGEAAEGQEKKDVEMKIEVKEEPEEKKEEPEEPQPVAALTEEEKTASFRKRAVSDLASWLLSSSFTKFSLPQKSEGFDDVRFPWAKKSEVAEDYLKKWVLKQKVTCRIEELQAGEWFKGKTTEWLKTLSDLQAKQNDYLVQLQKQPTPEVKKEEKKPEEGQDGKEDAETKEKEEGKEEKAAEEPPAEKVEKETTDPMEVDDILNATEGVPLFAKFAFEDWTLLSLRVELHLLVHAFKKDVNDPERVGIHESHLPFYYSKYFRKTVDVKKQFGVETNPQLLALIKDTIDLNSTNQVLEAVLPEDLENFDVFVKKTEESRRERQKRLDAGDETVRLKFQKPELVAPPSAVAVAPPKGSFGGGFKGSPGKGSWQGSNYGGGWGKDKGGGKGYGGPGKGDWGSGGFKGGYKG